MSPGNRNEERNLSHVAFSRLWKGKHNNVHIVVLSLQPKESLRATVSLHSIVSISGTEEGGLGVEKGQV